MSTKSSKRRQKRLNTNETNEEIEISDKSISPKKIDDIFKDDISEKSEPIENEHKNNVNDNEEQNGHENGENGNQNGNHDVKNGFEEEVTKEILNESQEIIELNVEETEKELHLSLDVTPEKEIKEIEEKSPVLTGRTTRSHKNSPKVDKSENGTDIKLSNEVQVVLTQLETTEVKTEEVNTNEEKQVEETRPEELEEKDTTNASIFVNVGNDTTHNVDITTTSIATNVDDSVSFIDTNKDVPYAQAIRTLSGRRTLRRDSPFVPNRGKSHLEKDITDSRRSYIPHISSVKRKNTTELPDDSKRYKTESSPGIFSYIASPLVSLKNRMSRTELPSSTPKLTSYNKYAQGNNIIEDMSQIDLTEETSVPVADQIEPKKWCSIM